MLVKMFSLVYENGVARESNIPSPKIVAVAAATKSETNLHHKPSHV